MDTAASVVLSSWGTGPTVCLGSGVTGGGVRRLVLTYLSEGHLRAPSAERFRDEAAATFNGDVVVDANRD